MKGCVLNLLEPVSLKHRLPRPGHLLTLFQIRRVARISAGYRFAPRQAAYWAYRCKKTGFHATILVPNYP